MENNEGYYENQFTDEYHSKLLNLSDGILLTEDGRTFYIHKYVLANSSKYFCALFCGMGKGKKETLIPGIRGEVLSNILAYLYTGNVHVTEENLCDLVVASDYLMLDDLLSQLKPHFKRNLTITNCLSILQTALEISSRDDISRSVFRFVQTHFERVVLREDSEIHELSLDVLKLLLSDKSLCVRSERTVWLAIINWVEADTANRLPWVPDLLMHLTLSDIDVNIANDILQHDIVATNPFCQNLFNIQSRLLNAGRLEIFQHYFQAYSRPMLALYDHRQPTNLHYISYYENANSTDSMEVYLTYDENLDLWRKVFEIEFRPEILFFLDYCIYLFCPSEDKKLFYNVIEKQWNELTDFGIPRYLYDVVESNGVIYVLGGYSATTGDKISDVEFYDSESDEWHTASSMTPVSYYRSVEANNSIYVFGYRFEVFGLDMVAQVYDPLSDTWNILPSDPIIRSLFAVVVYRELIYVIGGFGGSTPKQLKTVLVFDPIRNEWRIEADLPYIYVVPKAKVLDDKLIVYDNRLRDHNEVPVTNPPVQWNPLRRCWEESSFMYGIYKYDFLTVENSDVIHVISNENKDPATHFEASHFT